MHLFRHPLIFLSLSPFVAPSTTMTEVLSYKTAHTNSLLGASNYSNVPLVTHSEREQTRSCTKSLSCIQQKTLHYFRDVLHACTRLVELPQSSAVPSVARNGRYLKSFGQFSTVPLLCACRSVLLLLQESWH